MQIEIDKVGTVEVDDNFMNLTPEQQDATIAEISDSAKTSNTLQSPYGNQKKPFDESEDYDFLGQTIGGTGGAVGGLAVGLLLAPATFGLSVPIATAVGAALGGAGGEYVEQLWDNFTNDDKKNWAKLSTEQRNEVFGAAAEEGIFGLIPGIGATVGKGYKAVRATQAPNKAYNWLKAGIAALTPGGAATGTAVSVLGKIVDQPFAAKMADHLSVLTKRERRAILDPLFDLVRKHAPKDIKPGYGFGAPKTKGVSGLEQAFGKDAFQDLLKSGYGVKRVKDTLNILRKNEIGAKALDEWFNTLAGRKFLRSSGLTELYKEGLKKVAAGQATKAGANATLYSQGGVAKLDDRTGVRVPRRSGYIGNEGYANYSQQDFLKEADGSGSSFDVTPRQILEFVPVVGDILAAEEVYQEIKKPNPNWLLVGALTGGAILGLIPGVGDAAAALIKKGARRALGKGPVPRPTPDPESLPLRTRSPRTTKVQPGSPEERAMLKKMFGKNYESPAPKLERKPRQAEPNSLSELKFLRSIYGDDYSGPGRPRRPREVQPGSLEEKKLLERLLPNQEKGVVSAGRPRRVREVQPGSLEEIKMNQRLFPSKGVEESKTFNAKTSNTTGLLDEASLRQPDKYNYQPSKVQFANPDDVFHIPRSFKGTQAEWTRLDVDDRILARWKEEGSPKFKLDQILSDKDAETQTRIFFDILTVDKGMLDTQLGVAARGTFPSGQSASYLRVPPGGSTKATRRHETGHAIDYKLNDYEDGIEIDHLSDGFIEELQSIIGVTRARPLFDRELTQFEKLAKKKTTGAAKADNLKRAKVERAKDARMTDAELGSEFLSRSNYTPDKAVTEGMADAFSLLGTDPKTFKKVAPEIYRLLQERITNDDVVKQIIDSQLEAGTPMKYIVSSLAALGVSAAVINSAVGRDVVSGEKGIVA